MIKIMLDSASDCRNKEIYDIMVPIAVNIDGTEYLDGVDLEIPRFYELLVSSNELPHTSQPSPETFREIFEKIKEDGDEVIYIALSSGVSGTYQSAVIAKEMTEYDGIYIIDSRNVSHIIELTAFYARKLINEGLSAPEIVEKCEEFKLHTKVYTGVDTLEYLQKGGRIGKATALVGKIANIKPIVSVSLDGDVEPSGIGLGFSRAVKHIVESVKKHGVDTDYPVWSLYTNTTDNTEKLEKELNAAGIKVTDRMPVGPTVGTHVGTGVYGVAFVEKH